MAIASSRLLEPARIASLLTILMGMTLPARALSPDARPVAMKSRAEPIKPVQTILTDRSQAGVITVKFREGTRVRQRNGDLVAELDKSTAEDKRRLGRANLDAVTVDAQLATVKQLVDVDQRRHLQRMLKRNEETLDRQKAAAEANVNEELADLNLYYRIFIEDPRAEDSQTLIDALNALDIVEIAYAEPVTEVAAADIDPPTSLYTGNLVYFRPAPSGIDVDWARQFAGTTGGGVKLIDIEKNFQRNHEDLEPVFYRSGVMTGGRSARQHGSAVLGVIGAAWNSYGLTGIAPFSQLGFSAEGRSFSILGVHIFTYFDFCEAFDDAAMHVGPGDIILIELHAPGPASGLTCPCNCSQFDFVPMEFWQANFDIIRFWTAHGRVVVEAAGNGAANLDSSIYGGRFTRSVRDSGAILVGASGGYFANNSPACFTNFGSRVDVQGWGDWVATLGYGDWIRVNGDDDRQWYTNRFGGTSSATPIVAGAAASIQGHRKARGLPVLNSKKMRQVLVQTGTPQPRPVTQKIGPLPDLRRALQAHGTGPDDILIMDTAEQSMTGYIAPNGHRDFVFWARHGIMNQFSTCNGQNTDTVLQVWDFERTTLMTANNNSCDLRAALNYNAPASNWTAYVLRVKGNGAASGNFKLTYSYSVTP